MNESAHRPLPRRTAASLALAAGLAAVAGPASAAAAPRRLNSRQQAGQRVIFSYPGLTPPEALFAAIRAGECAGVIFFAENITDVAQLAEVSAGLQDAAAQSPVPAPLLLCTDQEGGQVNRVPGPPEDSAKQVGQAPDPVAAATATGRAAGENLRSAGVNLNLAPVLDVYREEGNFIDGKERSYGNDPAVVGELATAFLTAQQAAGVAATAKHFPGLGAAPADANTDLGEVTLDVPAAELRSVDQAPYPTAIAAGVKLVMPSWAVYPALDADRPAGLSPAILNDELRGRVGFTGVTVSDALEAGALEPYGGPGERAVLAAGAGMDLLLASVRDVAQGDEVVGALAAGLESGELEPNAFTAAVNRVRALRDGL